MIESKDFLRLTSKFSAIGAEESTPQGLSSFLRHHIFTGLGRAFAEIYFYRASEDIFVPERSSAVACQQSISGVPISIEAQSPLIDDFRNHRHYRFFTTAHNDSPPFLADTGNTNHVLFPLFADQDLLAILYVGSREIPSFPEDYILGLQTLTVMIASHIRNLNGSAALPGSTALTEKSEQLQQALYEISEQAHLVSTEEELYKSLHTIVARLLNAKNFIIALRQERGGEHFLKIVYLGDEFDAHMQGIELKIDPMAKLSFSGYLLKNGKPILLNPYTYDGFCLTNDIEPIGTKPQSLIGVPFYLEHLAGVVLVPSYHHVIFTDQDKDLLVYVARHIGDALSRKKLLDDMREANEIFSLFLQHSPMHVYIKEVKYGESRIVQASEAYGKILNKTAAELIDRNMDELFPAEFAAKTTANDWQVVSSNIPLQTEDHLGGRIYSTIKFPIIQGGKSLLAGYSVDITERKRAEEERLNLERQLQQAQKAESLGRMAGAIAHTFNNQLGVVMGNLELALLDLRHDAKLARKLASAMQGARKAAEVSGLMLTYLGQTTDVHEPQDLSESCRRSLMLLQADSSHGLTLKVDLPSPGPTVNANTKQIQQVLTNLVTNAQEAVAVNKGLTSLTVKITSPGDIGEAHYFPNDWQQQDMAYACLEVSDTGCGIDSGDFNKLFDPFFSNKFTGRGLGLSVVLGLVKAHNGVVTVQSAVGHGSTFRVYLPLSTEKVPEVQARVGQPAATAKESGTILLVDDEEFLRHMTGTMLTHLGYTVLAAKDGIQALEIFSQHQDEIRCVISDLTMPHMNGWQTLDALREVSPNIPLILSSGYDETQVLIGDHPEHPQAFLHKPYQLLELQAALAKALKI